MNGFTIPPLLDRVALGLFFSTGVFEHAPPRLHKKQQSKYDFSAVSDCQDRDDTSTFGSTCAQTKPYCDKKGLNWQYPSQTNAQACRKTCGTCDATGISSYGISSYDLYSYGLSSYGRKTCGTCDATGIPSYGISSYDLYSYGLSSYGRKTCGTCDATATPGKAACSAYRFRLNQTFAQKDEPFWCAIGHGPQTMQKE